jgi:hypothetical protein
VWLPLEDLSLVLVQYTGVSIFDPLLRRLCVLTFMKSRKVSETSRCYFDIPNLPNEKCKLSVYKRIEFSYILFSHLDINPTDNQQESDFLIPFLTSHLILYFNFTKLQHHKMQSFFLTALLVTSAIAAPSSQSHRSMFKRQACDQTNQPTTDEVVTAINTWLIDVQTVNSFLDNAITQPDAVISQAPNVLTFASDEPNELGEFLCPRFFAMVQIIPMPCIYLAY